MTFANYNFKDTTGDFNNIIAQLYIRQALAHLEDQQGYITAFMHGAGGRPTGRSRPTRRARTCRPTRATNPYPFSVTTAVSMLKSNGWTVSPGGTDVCAKPGTGAGECGAGIPAGTKLAFNLIYTTYPAIIGEQVTDLASEAKKVGITITLSSSNFNYMITNYLDPAAPANENKWAMADFGGETDDAVPDHVRPVQHRRVHPDRRLQQPDRRQADQRLDHQRQPGRGQDRGVVPDREPAGAVPAQRGRSSVPGRTTSSALNPQAWENLTQYYATPEFWYSPSE